MDIISHALAGAATGHAFGAPIVGAVFGVLPDLVLGYKRVNKPTQPYNLTHSLAFATFTPLAWGLYFGGQQGWLVFFALLSHLILDLPTHGKTWAPMLLYPYPRRFSLGSEWEWFNKVWWRGFALTLLWSLLWLYV